MPIITTHNVHPVQAAYFNPEAALHQKVTLHAGALLQIDVTDFDSHPQCNFNMARELMETGGAVRNENELLVLTQQWSGSVSACSVLVKYCAQNGWKFWQVEEQSICFTAI